MRLSVMQISAGNTITAQGYWWLGHMTMQGHSCNCKVAEQLLAKFCIIVPLLRFYFAGIFVVI
jgi:hypothetical protein